MNNEITQYEYSVGRTINAVVMPAIAFALCFTRRTPKSIENEKNPKIQPQ